tara:strand:+ start:247 stop:444 length:198 start_codon:yes stop_codon:yes gene_type:complete
LKAVPHGTQDPLSRIKKILFTSQEKASNINATTNTTNITNANTYNGYGTFEYATPRGYRKYVLKT